VQTTPDGKEILLTPLSPSDWEQRTVQTPKINPEEGVWVEPPVVGDCIVWRADLDKHYPTAPSVSMSSDDRRAGDIEPRRRPGTKRRDDWPLEMASEVIRLAHTERGRERLKNVAALGRQMKNFLEKELGWAPKNPEAIEAVLRALLKHVR
jgi:hypothetical protein